MNIKEAYRYGFATKLAALGMSPSEFEAAWLEKRAFPKGITGNLLALGAAGVGTAAVLPWLTGLMTGYQFGGGKEVSPADIEHLRQTSILSSYADAIKRMRMTNRRKARDDEKEKAMTLPKSSQYAGSVTLPPSRTGQLTVSQRIDGLRGRLNQPINLRNAQTPATMPGMNPVPKIETAVARQGLGAGV